jgi:transcriptional regulator with XRE-family HTH domain
LSEILRVERARRDLGLVEASKEIGINKETLARLEKGLGNPYYPTLKRIAEYYDIPVKDLLVASTIDDGGDSPKAQALPSLLKEAMAERPRVLMDLEAVKRFVSERAYAEMDRYASDHDAFMNTMSVISWVLESAMRDLKLEGSSEERLKEWAGELAADITPTATTGVEAPTIKR